MQDQLAKSCDEPLTDRTATGLAGSQGRVAELVGKTAAVTGSTSGIGLGIAEAFAKAGMKVMLNGFGGSAEINATRARLEKEFEVDVAYSSVDMTKPDEIVRMTEDAKRQLGTIDVLVNNTGIHHVEAIETFPVAKWEAIIAIDLSSPFAAFVLSYPQ